MDLYKVQLFDAQGRQLTDPERGLEFHRDITIGEIAQAFPDARAMQFEESDKNERSITIN